MDNRHIGIYDSGVGGAAVLRTAQKLLPQERYILYADFDNAPYGDKSKKEIQDLAKAGVERLSHKGVKAVVVACNTATSAAVDELRAQFAMPIIGMEPAIKPAAESVEHGKILVFATHATLRLMKFQKLSDSLGGKNIVPVECPGLSTLIESERPGSPLIGRYLEDVLSGFERREISAAVIGCTHYSYIEEEIKKATGCDVVFDGRYGTARHLKNILIENDMLGADGPGVEYLECGSIDERRSLICDFMQRPLSFEEI